MDRRQAVGLGDLSDTVPPGLYSRNHGVQVGLILEGQLWLPPVQNGSPQRMIAESYRRI